MAGIIKKNREDVQSEHNFNTSDQMGCQPVSISAVDLLLLDGKEALIQAV